VNRRCFASLVDHNLNVSGLGRQKLRHLLVAGRCIHRRLQRADPVIDLLADPVQTCMDVLGSSVDRRHRIPESAVSLGPCRVHAPDRLPQLVDSISATAAPLCWHGLAGTGDSFIAAPRRRHTRCNRWGRRRWQAHMCVPRCAVTVEECGNASP
jgi:hypothetical protein